MSSWANRHIPRKRDISQIPEQLRPTIVPRSARPEVLISESFQEVTQNEMVLNERQNNPVKAPTEPIVNSRQFVTKTIAVPNPSAFELTFNNKSFVFVILRHIRNTRDNNLWISSYNSIRNIYSNKIVIIDDNSSINTVDGKLINTEVIKSEFNGAGEILPYYYFLKNKWADKMIFLHDSMFLNRPFTNDELENDIRFHWYFNSYEPQSNNDSTKLSLYLSVLDNNANLNLYLKDPKMVWKGCFGAASIIDYYLVYFIEQKYKIFTKLPLMIRIRSDRETFERIFGLLFFFEEIVNNDNCSNFGNIMGYPNAFDPNNINYETASVVLRQRGYNSAIIKVWRGR